jgi:hypothetical protein
VRTRVKSSLLGGDGRILFEVWHQRRAERLKVHAIVLGKPSEDIKCMLKQSCCVIEKGYLIFDDYEDVTGEEHALLHHSTDTSFA